MKKENQKRGKTVLLLDREWQKLQKIADKDRRTVHNLMVKVLQEFLESYK